MEKIFDTWSRKVIAGGIQINQYLTGKNLSWDEVEAHLKKNPGLTVQIKSCPRCGRAMSSSRLKEGTEKHQEGYRTYWLCGAACCEGKGCGYAEFSTETAGA